MVVKGGEIDAFGQLEDVLAASAEMRRLWEDDERNKQQPTANSMYNNPHAEHHSASALTRMGRHIPRRFQRAAVAAKRYQTSTCRDDL